MSKKLVVVGGGAAGFFCALNAKRMKPDLEVLILEKTSKVLSKVRISGGGRCNVTHQCFEIPTMSARYPRGSNLVKKTFHQFFTTDTIRWFEERGVKTHAEADGRMFPVTNNSETIINCFIREMNELGVELDCNREVKSLRQVAGRWEISVNDTVITADFVCIACGGYPKESSFAWLKELGHNIEVPVPSLFTFNMPAHRITALMGVSFEQAQVKISGTRLQETGPVLITHWGLSGPAVLRLSAWGAKELAAKNYRFQITVNWLPDLKEPALVEQMQELRMVSAGNKIYGRNPFGLPQRFWEFLLKETGIREDWRWADLPASSRNNLVRALLAQPFEIGGKTTYKEEFVTAGGVLLSEVDANTFESKLCPDLFFAGEVLNVDGITGGYNFQHAWTSGFVVAKEVSGRA